MRGQMWLSLQRSPSFLDSLTIEGHRNTCHVARDKTGRVLGMCSRSVRRVWFNGEPAELGYLGNLRTSNAIKGRIAPLAAGFAACMNDHQANELEFDITSILADNKEAQRLLERGLSALPRYSYLAPFRTFVMPVKQMRMLKAGREVAAVDSLWLTPYVQFLNHRNRDYQFAPIWREDDFSKPLLRNLPVTNCYMIRDNERVLATGALWDQRAFKQTRILGYEPRIRHFRHLINVGLTMLRQPRLPAVGSSINLAYVFQLQVLDNDPSLFVHMLDHLVASARSKGLDYLVIGMDPRQTLAETIIKRCKARIIESRIYAVSRTCNQVPQLDPEDRVGLEVATL